MRHSTFPPIGSPGLFLQQTRDAVALAGEGDARDADIANGSARYYPTPMSVLTCKLPSALDGRLADLAKRRGVPKSVLVREAIEAKIAEEAAAPRRRPANLIEALGDSVGSVASGKRDLARNKKHLRGYGR